MTETYLSRAGNLGPIVEYIEDAGGSSERVFSKACLAPDVCDQPELLIPQRDVFLLLEHAARELDDPAFGARLGELLSLENLGQLGALLAVAPTVETAIDFAGAKACEMVQSGTVLKLETTDSEAVWSYRSLERATIGRPQDAYIGLGFMLAVIKGFRAPGWLPKAVIVPDNMRSYKSMLELAYGTDVNCVGDQFALMFDKSLLKVSRISASTEGPLPRELPIKSSIPSADDTVAITRALCAMEMKGDLPNLERVAARQGILARTLQRRLWEQGTTFRQIALEVVMEKADTLIKQSNWPIYRISLYLGYAETSQFSRAYKSWTGVRPLKARSLHLGKNVGTEAE